MKKTLLQKATPGIYQRADARFKQKEVEELAIAYLTGSIGYSQIRRATGYQGSSVYTFIAPALKRMYLAGKIKIKK